MKWYPYDDWCSQCDGSSFPPEKLPIGNKVYYNNQLQIILFVWLQV